MDDDSPASLGNVVPLPRAPDAVELRHLRAFVTVAEELNFSRAAHRLYVSQPALSRQIRALEQMLGCDLLRRSTHRVELTLAGEALLDRARPLLNDVDVAVASTRSVGGELLGRVTRLWEPVLAGAGELEEMRNSYEELHAQFSPHPEAQIRPVIAGGVPALLVTAQTARQASMLFLHGGGYALGSAFGYRPLASAIAVAAESGVLVPDYRLAPEHPFPAALDDALRAYLWMLDTGPPPDQITVAGDSAGGGLVMSLLCTLRQQELPQPGGAVLLCPGVDLTGMLDGTYAGAAGDVEKVARRFAEHYLAGHPADDPILSPLTADLSGLPRLLIQAATGDPSLVDAHRLTDHARECDVHVRLELYPVDTHVFQLFWPFLPEAAEAIQEIGQFARQVGGGSRPQTNRRG